MEIELKLLLNPSDVSSFKRHPLLKHYAIGKPQSRQLISIYFDTPDLYLQKNHTALRVRKVGARWVQTCKSGGQATAGLHQRPEWESDIGGAAPDLPALQGLLPSGTPVAQLLSAPGLADRLQPIFTTQFQRTIWLLRSLAGDEVELALDQGEILHGDSSLPISEIELELKSGAAASLFELALGLQHTVPLRAANASKAERGYGLHSPQAPAVVKAQPVALSSELTVEQGFQILLGNCLAHMQGNEDGVVHGVDPENLHQMRVGLRRLRAVLGLFKKIIPVPPEISNQLDWLGGTLGPARDWEVLAVATLADAVRRCPNPAQLDNLRQLAFSEAGRHRNVAATAVESRAYTRLLLMLGSWIEGRRWREGLGTEQIAALSSPLKKFAVKKLAGLQRKLLKRGRRIKQHDAARRHRIRIAAKKIRYATEFFEVYLPPKRSHAYVTALGDLQDDLGAANDRSVADRLLQQIADSHPEMAPGLAESCNLARELMDDGRKHNKSEAARLWQRFVALKPPVKVHSS
ncbi:Inorganic triphosphatase YgiF, contains CYTH and CHAD domains [Collimonas sp. OK607]|uniref:CYTH and CHAD domain-containing protein n=1 Tax=Collimonas sp. OK607 TaxID=1798194 RepID=UPI0008E83C38|nr:CYTH and CHAD domain-containing protein [Collimonas sp. OK607]SFB13829.1 Inorganic triphosphatase YgiF, contains CYTH and CHAD domains [Collimonas sp. OK607]